MLPIEEGISPIYQHVIARGLPYDRGYAYGEQAKEKILFNVNHYRQPGKLPPWETIINVIHEVYLPAIAMYYPSGLEEMKGIAAGAEISLDEIIMLNARYDLSRVKKPAPDRNVASLATANGESNECTSAAFLSSTTVDGSVITAQNWDMSAHLLLNDAAVYLEVHPDVSEGIPAMFIATEAGGLARSGMNSRGLGITANGLMTNADFDPLEEIMHAGVKKSPKPMLPISLVRRMFLESQSFSAGLVAINTSPRHVSNNLMVSDAQGLALCLEMTPSRVFTISPSPTRGYLTHSNHFRHPAFLAGDQVIDKYPGGSSWYRPERLEAGTHELAEKKLLTEENIIKSFCDHAGGPDSLCAHIDPITLSGPTKELEGYPYGGPYCTVSTVIYSLSKRTATVCKGPPCRGVFQTFALPVDPSR
ncbi:hypothetical protein BU16DRAFT_450867 [Lophium mytilinum]|uniref:Peptidase C45 hydrolase domain-containing protein n=1 Tax=Lophium mytilinum TaxID=390894 RepID=A0A6A6RA35_9PEZI|nr:hypothetical protein BU16DRAFT_450867 [Lophium mytilinum]